MEEIELNVSIKVTSDFINAVASKVAEINKPINIVQEVKKPKFYTVKEVSNLVKSTKSTITRHINLGLLKASKPGGTFIISEEDLEEYIKQKI